jgi:hypothetical protein
VIIVVHESITINVQIAILLNVMMHDDVSFQEVFATLDVLRREGIVALRSGVVRASESVGVAVGVIGVRGPVKNSTGTPS